MCDNCRAGCCHLPVEADLGDLIRLQVVEDGAELLPPKKIATQLTRAGIIQSFRARTGIYTLAQKADRSCVFLDREARCTVYDRRPETCRNFPRVGPRPNFCPHQSKRAPMSTGGGHVPGKASLR